MAADPKVKADVLQRARAHPNESARSIAQLFSVNPRSVARWFSAAGISRDSQGGRKRKAASKAKGARGGGGSRSGAAAPTRARNPAPKTAKKPSSRIRTRAEDMPEDDRVEAIAIVRGARRLAVRYIAKMEAAFDAWEARQEEIDAITSISERARKYRANPPPRVDRDDSQALLNMQRLAAAVCDTHPGLMEIAGAGEEVAEDKTARQDRVRAALNILEKK